MKCIIRYFLPSFLLMVLGISLVAPAHTLAQERTGLSVSPPTFEASANPGDDIKNTIRVENITDEPLNVSVDVRNFSALGEEGQVNLSKEDNSYALASWIKISPIKDTIAPKESKTFEYTINVPSNAQPGGRFGSIVFITDPKPVTSGSGVAVGQEIGSLLFLKIAGDVREEAKIESFKTGKKLYEYGPVVFETRVKNLGNVQFRPKGTITITNVFGKVVQTIPVDSRNVLPSAIRKMEGSWKNKWLFGPHTATVSLVYGNNNKILTASTSFWGLPYRVIAVIGLFIVGISFFIYRARQRISKSVKVLLGKD